MLTPNKFAIKTYPSPNKMGTPKVKHYDTEALRDLALEKMDASVSIAFSYYSSDTDKYDIMDTLVIPRAVRGGNNRHTGYRGLMD